MTTRLIHDVQQIFDNGVFRNFIEYIRYPLFRNLEPDSKITFDFPLTFFVGKNGGGKSSTLQSLYGCPLKRSLSEYWFSTALDPINDLKENRNCIIYAYKENDEIKEVLKQRAPRKNKLDYWEPSRPVKKYNMDLTRRNSPLEKNVEYIDFRSELSAFDSFMYFMPFNQSSMISSKQDYVRRYSGNIKRAFNSDEGIKYRGVFKSKPVKCLTNEEVKVISTILGKNYSKIDLLDHKFLKNWGFSVRFSSPELNYSEAFAGSGETAMIVLVHKIYNCPNNSLLLLDEPETSLHPGAQKRLIAYLLEQIKIKKLQVVISTHSPFLIEDMPAKSIKVFSLKNGLFHIENERNPNEAFYELEIEKNDKPTIIVEDRLAKSIINYVLLKKGVDVSNAFNLKYLPGGASALKQRITTYIELDKKPYIIFDGDQKLSDSHFDLSLIPPNEITLYKDLYSLLKIQIKDDIKFFIDGNKGSGNDQQKIESIKKYFDYYLSNVFYLPLLIPEDIIWNDDYAQSKIKQLKENNHEAIFANVKKGNAKDWFYNLCMELYDDDIHLNTLHQDFIIAWYNRKDDNFNSINDVIENIRRLG